MSKPGGSYVQDRGSRTMSSSTTHAIGRCCSTKQKPHESKTRSTNLVIAEMSGERLSGSRFVHVLQHRQTAQNRQHGDNNTQPARAMGNNRGNVRDCDRQQTDRCRRVTRKERARRTAQKSEVDDRAQTCARLSRLTCAAQAPACAPASWRRAWRCRAARTWSPECHRRRCITKKRRG